MKASKRGARANPAPDAHGALVALAAVLAPLVAEILAKHRAPSERIKHTESPLGKRRTLRLIRAGTLPAVKVGRVYYIRSEDFEAFMSSGRVTVRRQKNIDCADDLLDELRAAGWS